MSTRTGTALFPYLDPVTDRDDLLQKLRAAAAGGPYVVEKTPQGFDVKIDIVDAQWYTLIRRNGLTKVFTYSVRLDDADKKYSITDIANEVRLRDALQALVSDPALRASVGAANQAKARAEFDEAVMIARYRALYEDALNRPGALT